MASVLNRNIITKGDIDNLTKNKVPKSFDTNPPAAALAAPGGVSVPTEDDYITKLLKYVPIEIVGFYLFMQSIVDSNVTAKSEHAIWLLCLLIGSLQPLRLLDPQRCPA